MRIVVVEDDNDVAAALTETLERFGHSTTVVTRGEDVVAASQDTDFMLLDLGLPDLDGLEICRRVRSTSWVPIIVVTGRASEMDRVLLLRAGADDYVVKPCGTHELLARIEAVSRRVHGPGQPEEPQESQGRQFGPLRVDHRARIVHVNNREVALTRREFDLLAALTSDPGAVHSRETLISEVWDEHWFGSTRTLDVHIGSLRSKLGHRDWIRSVRGVGFRLCLPDVKAAVCAD